jgi:hypothetical protein
MESMMGHVCSGCVVGIEDEDDQTDEVRLLIWFNGEGDDNVSVKMSVPLGTFELRDKVRVIIERDVSASVDG